MPDVKELEREQLDLVCALTAERLTEYGRLELTTRLNKVLTELNSIYKQQLENINRNGNRIIN